MMKHRALAFVIRLITGVRSDPRLEVSAGGSQRVYFANHSSHLDFVVIWAALPDSARQRVRPVAAAEYWEKGPVRRWLSEKVFHAVLIPRDLAKMREQNPLEIMATALDEGADLIVFPEGTRSETGRLGAFKPGLFHLATRQRHLDLIPVFLENLNRILPKGEGVPVPLMGNAHFGEPIEPPADGESKPAFLQRARDAVLRLSRGALVESASPPPSPSS
jgi:1-acyl-sn-glycerol-3-phosphate acyltransferase